MDYRKAHGRRKGGKWSGAPKSARPVANRATRRLNDREARRAAYEETLKANTERTLDDLKVAAEMEARYEAGQAFLDTHPKA